MMQFSAEPRVQTEVVVAAFLTIELSRRRVLRTNERSGRAPLL